ncbi:dienelactone hydrolase family protein [Streptomyces sp. DSM 40750]|uniref:dienelactone hydrolase family protein n=1 Tax=Streptomyces sp. DSM 40750 TaxID=2801030 RepID=UPI002F4024D2
MVASYGGRDRQLKGAAARLDSALDRLSVLHDVKEYPQAGHAFLRRPLRRPDAAASDRVAGSASRADGDGLRRRREAGGGNVRPTVPPVTASRGAPPELPRRECSPHRAPRHRWLRQPPAFGCAGGSPAPTARSSAGVRAGFPAGP